MRTTIQKAAPQATERITYGIPTFYLNGNLVHFGAAQNHIGFYPTPSGISAFRRAGALQVVEGRGAISPGQAPAAGSGSTHHKISGEGAANPINDDLTQRERTRVHSPLRSSEETLESTHWMVLHRPFEPALFTRRYLTRSTFSSGVNAPRTLSFSLAITLPVPKFSGARACSEQHHAVAAFRGAPYSSNLSNTFTPRSVALRPLAGLVPVTTRPEVIE
jgi:hypothetical protein